MRRISILSAVFLLMLAAIPAAAQTTSAPTGVVNATLLNFRAAPDPFAPIIGQLPGGTETLIVGQNSDVSWYQVQLADSSVGWVYGEYIVVRGYAAEVPTVDAPPVPQPDALGLIRAIRLNVRATPDPLSDILRIAVAGERVEVLNTNGDDSWYFVEFEDGFRGWVYGEYVNLYFGGTENVQSVSVPASQRPSTTYSNGLVNQPRLNVRPAPDPNSTPLTSIGYLTRVDVIGRTANTSWLQIQVDGLTGWVYAPFIDPNVGNFENAPVTF